MKKILVMSPTTGQLFENGSSGGAEKGLVDIFQNFERVTFCVIGINNYTIKEKGMRIIFSKNRFFYYLSLLYQLANTDIFVCRAFSRSTLFFYIFAKLLNKKTIYFIASDADIGIGTEYMPNYHSWISRNMYSFVDVIIVQSEYQKEYLSSKYKNKTIVYLKKSVSIDKNNYNKKRNYILWVGRDDSVKGLDILKKLLLDLPNLRFLIVGLSVPINYKNAKSVGRVNQKKMFEYYAKAKFLIWTSHISGTPYVFLESLNSRTPIISYKFDTDNLLYTSKGGFCANGNYNLFLIEIKKKYYDLNWIIRSGNNGYNYISKNHNMDNYISDLKKILYEK